MRTSFFSSTPTATTRSYKWTRSSPYTSQKLWALNKTHDKEAKHTLPRGFRSSRTINGTARRRKGFILGNWEHSDLARNCHTPKKLGAVSPFLMCLDKICRCSLGRKEGDREFEMGNCCAVRPWEYLPLRSPLSAASTAWSVRTLFIIKF